MSAAVTRSAGDFCEACSRPAQIRTELGDRQVLRFHLCDRCADVLGRALQLTANHEPVPDDTQLADAVRSFLKGADRLAQDLRHRLDANEVDR